MTMIERVARGIAAKAVGADVWGRMASTQRAMFRAQAVSALAVLADPDDAMIAAGELECRLQHSAKRVLAAMIQAAIDEAPPPPLSKPR